MKELYVAPINPESKKFLAWFDKVYHGIKGGNQKKLYAMNEKYCLIKMVYPGYSPAWGARSGTTTEYIVTEINSELAGYGQPKIITEKFTGRLLMADIEYIEKKYKLIITK